jgi:hypothetical protein
VLPSIEEAIQEHLKTYEGFKHVIEISGLTKYSDVFSELKKFMDKDYNLLVRAFLVNNLFAGPNTYFGNERLIGLVMQEWIALGYNDKKIRKHIMVHDLQEIY